MNRDRFGIELELAQYSRLLQIRKLLSGLLLILIAAWVFLTSFALSVPLSHDPARITLVVFIGIIAPVLLATNLFYSLCDKDKY
jgi:hypothetical protein